jgi:aryl-alcohol dehydrogenase-like predicted oxidoreductase
MAFYWGTSEWSAQQLQEAIAVADRLGLDPPLFDQCEYSMVQRERLEQEYLPLYPALGTTIWSPLAGGVLTGKYLEADAATGDSRYAKMVRIHLSVSFQQPRTTLFLPSLSSVTSHMSLLDCN